MEFEVTVALRLSDDANGDGALGINVRLVGHFHIEADDTDQFDKLSRYNTVAMMMPYVRSQLTLLTSQPGLTPLILPVFDVKSLVDDSHEVVVTD